ncbi:division/cell wall cluster transcriptional repressor MraZ [Bifidobacteriaceae bacterium NR044]|nr:division/cell wall cluster transcriptional repressor MraZ [Bifidobacteriaceae bacterium NR043]MBF9354138.1 division/cell wall cluster transcriptional repressor MraZ [Bifidobacteriaceae bacterium NR044]RFT38035.1 division/cell wall cluster transcriptional repressor MraZ [Bifidobacteriaceae bacterium NR003]
MARRAANKQPRNKANSASRNSVNQAGFSTESDMSQQTQMPLQAEAPQILTSYVQPVQPQHSQHAQGSYGVPSTSMPAVQQAIQAPTFTSTPSGAYNSATQAAAMPIAPFSNVQQPMQQPVQPMQQPMQQPVQYAQNPAASPLAPILLGTYTPKIDDKGRVALPAKFRAQLGSGFVMARGQERCVYVLPMTEFQRMTTQIQRTSMSNKSARDYLRVFLSGAVDEEPDKQGRIVVPPMLRDYASLGNEIVVIGVGTRAEIWNKSAWEAYLADREQGYADIADDVLPAVM